MNSDGNIARIDLEPETNSIAGITMRVGNLRFNCKRCATLCCKLGGPTPSKDDIERLERAGHHEKEFMNRTHTRLKDAIDGSCAYLRFNNEGSVYECAVYKDRPLLCQLFPFHFEKTNSDSMTVKIMPCMGINRHRGEPIDENLIAQRLTKILQGLPKKTH